MRKFIVTSERFSGQAEFVYNDKNTLAVIDFSQAELQDEHIRFLKKQIPVFVGDLEMSFKEIKTITIVESCFNITFEMFWETYNMKRNKLNAEQLWAKLSKNEQVKAYYSISDYNNYCARNVWYNKLYPDTYLRKKHFNDEWNKI